MNGLTKKNAQSSLYIVGAGPGDPELLTIKAYNALKIADVILFDNLANQKLLDIAPEHCKKVYVGKKPYEKYASQDQIHELISVYAAENQNIVRLKGGDPFIFGRGFEEALFARERGMEIHYIPGISSMQAAGMSDIPLTHRGISEGVWVMTGTKKDGSLSADLQLAMQSKATVVIYMGMKKLNEIADTYIYAGKGDTPAAIIQHASLPNQKKISCNINELPAAAANAAISHPAIIIIGDVIRAADAAIYTPFIEHRKQCTIRKIA
ncbi:uroporphyrinogen-III C-methyltransferase [Mucilaginibacter hurinus]|uniref:uroporphyrinogen-III C-methyltransferase n=1 Tax=Mucilaginibacter hurinus TaxID=2201324 RepID=A0A367GKV8_9SPHI|nr:uroporphyrinogen-III C-methyltransferase [Mucilaginibacter hurinus]RCH53625.1 uroporphyrinogen-III C-methyltransferase [Mucilaginibacter hurinus]